MGTLRELESENKTVHMYLASSGIIDLFIYDTLKQSCQATLESIIEVKTITQFHDMLDVINMSPFAADKWLVIIHYKAVKVLLKKWVAVFDSPTTRFLIKVKNYKEFKEFKELYPEVNDLYLSLIRHNEVMYLLKPYSGISEKLIDFVAKSYSREPEKIFELRKELQSGLEVPDRKAIVKLLGVSAGSINYFALQLLKDPPTTERGMLITYRHRVKTAYELGQAYNISTFRNFLLSAVKDIITIKELYLNGVIYDRIKNIPDCFDEQKLSRYNYYLDTINHIPMSRVMKLFISLKQCGVWRSQLDMVRFLYTYYGGIEQ